MYQHWAKLLFIHFPIDPKLLRPLIPGPLSIDTFDQHAWIAIVPFTMWGIRASFLPAIPGTSAFHELNVRTYVHVNGVPGVWFFSLDAANRLAVWAARWSYQLPYFFARMSLRQEGGTIKYESTRIDGSSPPAGFEATWTSKDALPPSSPESLEFFLTERYCLYAERDRQIYRARIFHQPWPLQRAELNTMRSTMLEPLGLVQPACAPVLHYAESLSVSIWPLHRVKTKPRTNPDERESIS